MPRQVRVPVVVFLVVLWTIPVAAQPPSSDFNLVHERAAAPDPPVVVDRSGNTVGTVRVPAPNNVWLAGTQIAYRFLEDPGFDSNLFATGRLVYKLKFIGDPPFQVAVVSNIGPLVTAAAAGANADSLANLAKALFGHGSGIEVGIWPYCEHKGNDHYRTTLFGSAQAKIDQVADSSGDRRAFLQGRLLTGGELALGSVDLDGSRPLTMSGAVVLAILDRDRYKELFRRSRSTLFGFEATMVIPVMKGAGFLLESIAWQNQSPTWRAALLVAAQVN
jgi:hypothetical protein